jgi:hypothetical protein
LLVPTLVHGQEPAKKPTGSADPFAPVQSFLRDHCVKCQNAAKKTGGYRLDDLDGDVGKDIERWFDMLT